jgi:hypothetical protein
MLRDMSPAKVKVNLSQWLINESRKHSAMKGIREQKIAPTFLISPLDGGEWSAYNPWERAPCTHIIEGCVDPKAGLDTVV